MPRQTLPANLPRRSRSQLFGTGLIVAGMVTVALTLGLPAWQSHQRDAETAAFLRRVATPPVAPTALMVASPGPATTPIGTAPPPTATAPARTIDRTILAAPPPPPSPTPTRSAEGAPAPTATPVPPMPRPTRLSIPAIKVETDIVEVGISPIAIDGQRAVIWDVPAFAVGHHFSSANPGEGENVVLSGHDDWQGEVFRDLYKLRKGDEIAVRAGDRAVRYRVDELLLLPETGQPLAQREANARFIGTTGDERLTLVTCWPYGVDDHRLVVIARPAA